MNIAKDFSVFADALDHVLIASCMSKTKLFRLGLLSKLQRTCGSAKVKILERFGVTSKIAQVTAPSLVIWGRQDVRGSLEEAERVAKLLPDGQWMVYEDCGHLPYL